MRRLLSLAVVATIAASFVAPMPSRAATVAGTWPVGAQPLGLAVDSVTGKVYVANSHSVAGGPLFGGGGVISVVDPNTGTVGEVVTTLPASFVAVDPVGRRLYSSNADFAGNGVSVDAFDLDSGAEIGSLPVGGLGLAVDHAGGRLYVCTGSSLKVIDAATFSVVDSVSAPPDGAWFDVVLDPERHRIYVSNIRESAPTFFVLDDRDLSTVAEIPLATPTRFAIAVDATSHVIYAAGAVFNGNGFTTTLSVIDPDTLSVVHQSSVPGFVLGIALAPSRHRIYLSDNDGRRIYGLDDGTYELAETIPLAVQPPGLLAIHPNGRLLFGRYDTRSTVNSELIALDPANHPPVFQGLTLSPSAPLTSDTLQADATASDPDLGSSPFGTTPVAYSYEWLRNGVLIPGAAGTSLDLSVPGNGDRGDTISVRVTATDGELSTVATTSIVIGNSMPTAAVSLSDPSPTTATVVSAHATASDPDNDALSYRFVWKVNGVVRRTASGANATDSFDLGSPGSGDKGDGIVVEVVASDGTLDSATATASGTVVNSAPTVAISLNTTAPTSKTLLVATVIGQDADQDALTYVYVWSVNGVVKRTITTTATSDRYDLRVRGNGDKGDVVTVRVTATDGSLASPPASLTATVQSH